MTSWNPSGPLILETERFKLRPLVPADATDDYISWWNDEEIQAGLGKPPRNWDRAQAQRHISSFDNRRRFRYY